jgi:hypothetical protein
MVTIAVGVPEISTSKIKVYPVPANDRLHIESATTITGIEVYSVLGNRVISLGEYTGPINVSGLKNGVYFIKISTENAPVTTKRIVIN